MPFYEYQCRACGAQIEVLQKITDAPLRKCPECGTNRLRKLVSAPVFRLKGGGWYETDFKGDKDVKRNLVGSDKGEGKSEDKPEDKSAAKPEEKPAGKSESRPEKKAATGTESKPAASVQAGRTKRARPVVGKAGGRRMKR